MSETLKKIRTLLDDLDSLKYYRAENGLQVVHETLAQIMEEDYDAKYAATPQPAGEQPRACTCGDMYKPDQLDVTCPVHGDPAYRATPAAGDQLERESAPTDAAMDSEAST